MTELESELLAACKLALGAISRRVRPGYHSVREGATAAAERGATETIRQDGAATLALIRAIEKAEGR